MMRAPVQTTTERAPRRSARVGVAALLLALILVPVNFATAQERTQEEVNAALRGDSEIFNGLYVMGIAHGIRDTCPDIDARMLRANSLALSLYNRARSLGYTYREIRTFLRDDSQQEYLRERVIAYYASRGARVEDVESICALGRAEIEAGSSVGALLRAR